MNFFKLSQQDALIGHRSAEVADKMKLADDKGTRSPSQIFIKQT